MKILIVTPAGRGTRLGNWVTAERWQRILKSLGHRVTIAQSYGNDGADVLVALHARRSHAAIQAFHQRYPERPILVALTGTDIYGRSAGSNMALESFALAFRLIALQALALREVPRPLRAKGRVIYQSFAPKRMPRNATPRRGFQAAVIGHLRDVKDPLRTALAARGMPNASQLRVVQAGAALEPQWERRVMQEMQRNPRYRWIGYRSATAVSRLMSSSDVLVVSSKSEGGANVISEAIGWGLPILASRVPGNVGLLGAAYPGYFKVGDTEALRRLLWRAERVPAFMDDLRSSVRRLVPKFEPAAEQTAWRNLLSECVRAVKPAKRASTHSRHPGAFRQPQRRKSTL